MSVTPFLKLQKPPFDTIPWDEAVNGNMDTIDAFIQRYMAVPNYVGAWANGVAYTSGQNVLDISDATIYLCQVTHTSSPAPTTFQQDRDTHPTFWVTTTNVVSGGNTSLSITEVAPTSAKAGDLWWNSADGQLYLLYNDGNSMQWVIANNQAGNIGDAPRDGSIYGRQMGSWVASQSIADVGRNKLHNGLFNIAQRGVGGWTGNSQYTADRWMMLYLGGTFTTQIIGLSDTDRTQIGDDAAIYALSCNFAGSATGGSYTQVVQKIEDVRRLGGKAITLSFWSNCSVATAVNIQIYQVFGSGGSPSPTILAGQVLVSLTPGWKRYTASYTMPTTIGKTTGTNGDSWTQLGFMFSEATTPRTATVNLWGVQLEIGSIATPLEKPDPRYDLANCQRFYQAGGSFVVASYATAGNNTYASSLLPVVMRGTPTVALVNNSSANITGQGIGSSGSAVWITGTATATGSYYINTGFTASADL